MLLENIRAELTKAMKLRDEARKSVLRMVIGDAGQANAVTDSDIQNIMRKMIERNQETIVYLEDRDDQKRIDTLKKEISILQGFLPRMLSHHEIRSSLAPIVAQMQACSKEGIAIGMAMKYLKENGAQVDGKDVREVVLGFRKEDG
jgi:uncharacterized protein